MSRYSSANTFGPLSIGNPDPLKIRPSMSSETGSFMLEPVNSTWVALTSMPDVPSKTWTIAFRPETSRTWPPRTVPSGRVRATICERRSPSLV